MSSVPISTAPHPIRLTGELTLRKAAELKRALLDPLRQHARVELDL